MIEMTTYHDNYHRLALERFKEAVELDQVPAMANLSAMMLLYLPEVRDMT
jgi:hypothetical protein